VLKSVRSNLSVILSRIAAHAKTVTVRYANLSVHYTQQVHQRSAHWYETMIPPNVKARISETVANWTVNYRNSYKSQMMKPSFFQRRWKLSNNRLRLPAVLSRERLFWLSP
jgi:hypothetical protein